MTSEAEFSYSFYRAMLRRLKTNFDIRRITAFDESDNRSSSRAFIRHDIDTSITDALALARVEKDIDITSTYMVLTDSPLYEIENHTADLRKIIDIGHDIGLHYDLNRESGQDALPGSLDNIRSKKEYLESAIDAPVTSISFHRPSSRVIGRPKKVVGMINTYRTELMSAYISDSKGEWGEVPPFDQINSVVHPCTLQLLTHPIWWGEEQQSPVERLDEFVASLHDVNIEMIKELEAIYPGVTADLE